MRLVDARGRLGAGGDRRRGCKARGLGLRACNHLALGPRAQGSGLRFGHWNPARFQFAWLRTLGPLPTARDCGRGRMVQRCAGHGGVTFAIAAGLLRRAGRVGQSASRGGRR
eukprot:9444120-Pyramimonas_sp.AAC.1